MFQNVAIIVSIVSLVQCQPIHDDVLNERSYETSPSIVANVSNSATVPRRPELNARPTIVEISTKPMDWPLPDALVDQLASETSIQETPKNKRELITLGALVAAGITLWSAVVVELMSRDQERNRSGSSRRRPRPRRNPANRIRAVF